MVDWRLEDAIAVLHCKTIMGKCESCPYYTNEPRCEEIMRRVTTVSPIENMIKMIMNTDEKSATKCFETINRIKKGDIM